MHSVFKHKMKDTNFLKWLAFKLNIRASRFLTYVANWKNRDFTETRGNLGLQLALKQKNFRLPGGKQNLFYRL